MNKTDLVKEWFDLASIDLQVAAHLFGTMHPPISNRKKQKPRWPVAVTGVKLCFAKLKLSPARCEDYYDAQDANFPDRDQQKGQFFINGGRNYYSCDF